MGYPALWTLSTYSDYRHVNNSQFPSLIALFFFSVICIHNSNKTEEPLLLLCIVLNALYQDHIRNERGLNISNSSIMQINCSQGYNIKLGSNFGASETECK